MRQIDEEQRKPIYLPYGDKFTKKPLQRGKYLILLGRMHIQAFNMQNFTTKILLYHGEDQAERQGQALKRDELAERDQEKSAGSRSRPQQSQPSNQLLSLNLDQVRTSQGQRQ